MQRRGLIGIGPLLFFVPLVSLLATAASIILGLGLMSGLLSNRHAQLADRKTFWIRILVIAMVSLGVIAGVHAVTGPTGNLLIGMLWGTILFAIIIALLSINTFRDDRGKALKTLLLLSLAFLLVSVASVLIVHWL